MMTCGPLHGVPREAATARYAAIDVGSNTVLLLVAERRGDLFVPVLERAEITRLGRGVDRTGRFDPAAVEDTTRVLGRYASEARQLGVAAIACVATSAARDASNGADFFAAARRAAGLAPEVISGDEEARLVWASAWRDFGGGSCELAVLDVGGGSTEIGLGSGPVPRTHQSLQVGAVRLTERVGPGDPPGALGLRALSSRAAEALEPARAMAEPPPPSRLVGTAGTVTTLAAVEKALPTYDGAAVHGSELTLEELTRLYLRLGELTTPERARLPGMEPKRADVIVAGCAIVLEAMRLFCFDRLTVSDRGVRWGLLYDRFGRD
ncbi:MAG TPA: Ppx/GppA phosphatase family protein [Anaeromyxobacteraceae bacterium]|nr:Ppx/GppA phosphatase family protein [Anaeromyxobacteraceae bacterium]